MKSKCETCIHHCAKIKDVIIRPSSSACTWRTEKIHRCKKECYGDKYYLPSKARCEWYKRKPTDTRWSI